MASLFEQGGMTLWAILFASILLWILIIERYWFHWREMPKIRSRLYQDWVEQRETVAALLKFRRIEALVGDLRAEAPILLVEHDMDAVFALADRISVLVYVQVIATGSVQDIRTNPRVREAYLGEGV